MIFVNLNIHNHFEHKQPLSFHKAKIQPMHMVKTNNFDKGMYLKKGHHCFRLCTSKHTVEPSAFPEIINSFNFRRLNTFIGHTHRKISRSPTFVFLYQFCFYMFLPIQINIC